MTTLDPTTLETGTASDADAGSDAAPGAFARLLAAEADWLTSTDHKKIGRLFVGGGLLGLLATIVVNVLLAADRGLVNVDNDALAQLLDAQRVGMVFGALLPLTVGLCLAIVPLQLGARSLAFPRLAATGFWMWTGGMILSIIALANNGGGEGGDADMVDLFLAAHGLMAIGLAAAAGSIATSVLTTRAPGMTMRRVPFFSMSALITALGILLVMPVLLGTIAYLFLDHRNSRQAFGGNTALYEWAFWVFTQPTTLLFAIPALGVLAEGAPLVFKQRTPARGVMFAGFALAGTAAFAALTQRAIVNLPWSGSQLYLGDREDVREKLYDTVAWALFNLLPLLGIVIVLLMTLFLIKPVKGDKPTVTPALAFGFLGVGMILMGVLGNALYAIDDMGLQGTQFEEGALVYVVYGAVLAVLGGLAHWSSKLWGTTMVTAKVLPLAGLGFVATVLASLPSYVAGFDQQRDFYDVLVIVGHALMGLTVLAFIGLLATSKRDDDADINPFGGQTLEWSANSPAPTNNFIDAPTVMSAEPVTDMGPVRSGQSDQTNSDKKGDA